MKRILNVWPLAVLAVLLFFCAAFGQSSPDEAQVDQNLLPSVATSEASVANPVGVSAVVAVIVPLLLGLIKGWLPIKWRKYLPILAPIVGELLTQAISAVFMAIPNGVGAAGGLAGVGVRETMKRGGPLWSENQTGSQSGKGPRIPPLPNKYGSEKAAHPITHAQFVIAFGLFCVFAGQACKTLDRAASAVTRPQVTTVTNTVTVTNLLPIAVPVHQPGETVFKTNFVDRVFTNTVVEHHTNYVAKEGIAEGLQTARVGSVVAGVFNPGAGAVASGVLGVLSAGLGLLVARKNKDAAAANAQLTAVIKGVEQLSEFDSSYGEKAKEVIAAVSKELGVSDALHATVQKVTN